MGRKEGREGGVEKEGKERKGGGGRERRGCVEGKGNKSMGGGGKIGGERSKGYV